MIRLLIHKQPRQVAIDLYDGDALVRANAIVIPNDQGGGNVANLTAQEFAELVGRAVLKEINGGPQ